MREIKFRIWDEAERRMMSWEEIDENDKFGIHQFLDMIEEDGFEVMQYTGVKDKNGRDIYEGDVLDVTTELLTNLGQTRTGKMHTTYYEVLWNVECWATKVLRAKTLVIGHVSNGLKIPAGYGKLIGNIYENPELLP